MALIISGLAGRGVALPVDEKEIIERRSRLKLQAQMPPKKVQGLMSWMGGRQAWTWVLPVWLALRARAVGTAPITTATTKPLPPSQRSHGGV